MKKKKKFLIILIVMAFFTILQVNADSGWDSSYDSGSSWDSGSSYDSGSSWSSSSYDSDYSSGSSYSGSSTHHSTDLDLSPSTVVIVLFLVAISMVYPIVIMRLISKSIRATSFSYHSFDGKKLSPTDLVKEEKDTDKFYNKFLEIQYAWQEINYSLLRNLCTDELFNTYKADLEVLKLKNGKNIMSSFSRITDSIKEEGNKVIYSLEVEFYDFVIDTTNNRIIRGNDYRKVHNKYEMIFVKEQKDYKYCPNCGAELKDLKDGKCSYCDSKITKYHDDYILSSKKRVE